MDNKLLERIQKLLALADPEKNDSQAQIEAALEKVGELLAKHSLTMEQVQSHQKPAEIKHERVFERYRNTDGTLLGDKWNKWFVDLAEAVAFANYCQALHAPSMANFIGREQDVKIAAFMFDNLFHRLVALSRQEMKRYTEEYKAEHGESAYRQWGSRHPKIWRRTWLEGAVSGLYSKLTKDRREKQWEAFRQKNQAYALIVQHDKAIQVYLDEIFPHLKDKPGLTDERIAEAQGSADAWLKGNDKGKDLGIQQGVEGGSHKAVGALSRGEGNG